MTLDLGSEILSRLGMSTWGAGAAASLYAISANLEKSASDTAKADIAAFLDDYKSKFDVTLVTRHVPRLFDAIFGIGLFGRPLFHRSLILTSLFFLFTIVPFEMEHGPHLFFDSAAPSVGIVPAPACFDKKEATAFIAAQKESRIESEDRIQTTIYELMLAIFMASVPDYLGVCKSRFIVKRVTHVKRLRTLVIWSFFDLGISLLIVGLWWSVALMYVNYIDRDSCVHSSPLFATAEMQKIFSGDFGYVTGTNSSHVDVFFSLLILSTVFTSIWMTVMLLGAITARLLIALRFPLTTLMWFFNPHEHPIKIVGGLAAMLLFLSATVVGMFRG